MKPDVHALAARLPRTLLGSAVLAGACFSLMNALLEEIFFRGVTYDALESQWGWRTAVIISGALFGAFHIAGYPPGPLGAVMAGVYGIMLGWLRRRTGGLLWPTIAHVVADATIFVILVHAGGL
jgi:membrane protease YdiL (CAAX protease family)